tara:strand:- start:2875 stop:3906 length:1032 start_codon:yes stop_codon:yes gene_type:complete
MKKILVLLLLPLFSYAQLDLKKTFKFSTFYGAVNGGTSISDIETFSVTDGLGVETIQTPFDYNITLGLRKIARFGYENKANTFYDGTESNYSDAATVGKIKGVEFLFEIDYKRQEGVEYLDQNHFIRYVGDNLLVKTEYLKDGFADVQYFETSERYKYNISKKLSLNIGAAQRIAEPYGYDPLASWKLDNGNIHYTYLALQEGYNVDVYHEMYYNPNGDVVAYSSDVWEQVVIPGVLADYTERKRNELPAQWNHSIVVGFDYYHYTKTFWLHSWANLLPYHLNMNTDYSYHNYIDGQWLDYSGGVILGKKFNKRLGMFAEGKYNKYWNREWYDFKLGINYIIR